jgi:hypothetical protein
MFWTLMRSRRLLRTLWRLLFRLQVVGRENLASAEATIPVLGSGKTNHVALAKTLIDSGA